MSARYIFIIICYEIDSRIFGGSGGGFIQADGLYPCCMYCMRMWKELKPLTYKKLLFVTYPSSFKGRPAAASECDWHMVNIRQQLHCDRFVFLIQI